MEFPENTQKNDKMTASKNVIKLHWMNKLRELMQKHPDDPKTILKEYFEWGKQKEDEITKDFENQIKGD